MAQTNSVNVIFNADDFGKSSAINQAVVKAHQEGVLTSASVLVNGKAFNEAVKIAQDNPRLGVGLHLCLANGRSTLNPEEIPNLVDKYYRFPYNPITAGLKYYFLKHLRPQLRQEIEAQFAMFFATGIPLDHVDGHVNIHLHPSIFSILKHRHREWSIKRFRLTQEPLFLNLSISPNRFFYKISHWMIFKLLSFRSRPSLVRRKIIFTDAVFGLLQTGAVTEQYLLKLLPRLKPGTYEIYLHPTTEGDSAELAALTSPNVKKLIQNLGIKLVRYQDLC
jgi:hopanoid biosynthesis associated protein HpnK